MGVYIGMEMPKEPDEIIEIAIFGDGKVIQTGESWRNLENGKCYYTPTTPEKFFNAVTVPPHGRLIDADKIGLTDFEIILCQKGNPFKNALEMLLEKIENAPTIIPEDGKDIKVPTREEGE